ncbi:myosin-M heavy chain-like isoform X1 [Artemia franciscana]
MKSRNGSLMNVQVPGPFVSRVLVSWDDGPPLHFEGMADNSNEGKFITKIKVQSDEGMGHNVKFHHESEYDINRTLCTIDAANYITSFSVNKDESCISLNYADVDEVPCDSLEQNIYSEVRTESEENLKDCHIIQKGYDQIDIKSAESFHKKVFRLSTALERHDSGLGSELHTPLKRLGFRQKQQDWCWDCDAPIHTTNKDSRNGLCDACVKRRGQRREAVGELLESELRYSRDLRLVQEEFHRPMLAAGLLDQCQTLVLFNNISDLYRHSISLVTGLRQAIGRAAANGDVDLMTVCIGRLILEHAAMLPAFRHYCSYAGEAFKLLAQIESQIGPVQTFLKTSERDNPLLRRMGLHAFLMVPIQRVTKYPLLLQRIVDATPSWHTEARKWLEAAKALLQHHLQAIDDAVGKLQSYSGKGPKTRTKFKM